MCGGGDGVPVPAPRGHVERGIAVIVHCVDVGLAPHEEERCCVVAPRAREMKQSLSRLLAHRLDELGVL